MNRYFVALGLAAIISGGLPAARFAHAAEVTGDPPTEAVRFDGSELASSAGVTRVYGRLAQAAEDVCRSFDSRDPERQMRYRRCVAEALERAVRDVHDGKLSAYHRAKTGATRAAVIVAGFPGAAR